MSNVLPTEKRLRVLAALVDGNSIRATERMTDVNARTIMRLLVLLGAGAERLHDRLAHDLRTSLIQMDEIWSFVGKKDARVTKADAPGIGEAYTFAAMDTLSRFVLAWRVGRRDEVTARAFLDDVRARVVVMPQITSDGFAPYIGAVGAAFGLAVDYVQTVKNYRTGAQRGPDHRYEPPRDPFITKRVIYGAPDVAGASTSYIERLNGTTRHFNGRMRRLCLAFSKKPEHHRASISLHYAHYNLCHVVRTLRVTPAMQAGITDHVWTLEELLEALLDNAPSDPPRAQPLEPRTPAGPARPLPNGRGFLRLVPGAPAPSPAPAPGTPGQTPAPRTPAKPSGPVQLSLFDPPTDE